MTNGTRSVVEAYFNAWTSKRVDAAFACLAPDLEFIGPSAHFTSAEQFRPGLAGFAALTRSARITHLIVEGDTAAMLYDCDFIAPSDRTTRIASFFRVAAGKIAWYETAFDPSEFRKVMAAVTLSKPS
jgi:ketosteroid isomerase-like protein